MCPKTLTHARACHTYTCGWQDGLESTHHVTSFPVVVAVYFCTCAAWGLAWVALFFFVFCFFKFVKQPFVGCQMHEEHIFPFLFDTFFLLKELWESTEELEVRSSVLKNWKRREKWRFSLLVHISRSLPESCRIWILRLVSKFQRSCFACEVSSDFCSEPGNPFIF